MEWESNDRDAWVPDAQRWICQINGVLECKIELDDQGEISGIHVVAGMDRDPRHVVRDVESLLKARLAMDVYYKKIGVVQVTPQEEPAEAVGRQEADAGPGVEFIPPKDESAAAGTSAAQPEPLPDTLPTTPEETGALPDPIPAVLMAEDHVPRVVCTEVGVMASDMLIQAEVQLRAGDLEAEGYREGGNCRDGDLELVAQATLEALGLLLDEPVYLFLREVRPDHLGGQPVIVCCIDVVEGRTTQTLFGSCGSGHNRPQAVVHAVLDALNRRLSLHPFKAEASEA